jgi:hypothetical protein
MKISEAVLFIGGVKLARHKHWIGNDHCIWAISDSH